MFFICIQQIQSTLECRGVQAQDADHVPQSRLLINYWWHLHGVVIPTLLHNNTCQSNQQCCEDLRTGFHVWDMTMRGRKGAWKLTTAKVR